MNSLTALDSRTEVDLSLARALPVHQPFSNMPPAPAHLILMAAVRGWAHVDNQPVEDAMSGRPPRRVWMPRFLRSMERSDWSKVWVRLALTALQAEKALPETLNAVARLEDMPYEQPFLHAFADILEQ